MTRAAQFAAALAVLAALSALAPLAGGHAATLDAAGGPPGAAAAHPTPPPGSPTETAQVRTPTGDGTTMRMRMAENGTVMNGNADTPPPGCDGIAGTKHVTVKAGEKFAEPGEAFAFSRDRIQAPPCTRLRVTFVNTDEVRHQFMVHGLPREVYPMGMFTIAVDGPGRLTGTFVTPAKEYVLHTHCSLPQHQQKGMLMRVVIGDGSAGRRGGPGHGHGGHTHTAGGHSPNGVAGPGFGPVVAVVALAAAAVLALRRR